ncbi:MAG: hypothetical protein LC768_14400 [Acidobacteria bacterium]|nr:hypothetical protein [Acidobacteriota bacterium]MCA1639501.1 hypothetical protein [Acidobacteriota bacterium]
MLTLHGLGSNEYYHFVYNSNTKLLHYDGASWREIVSKFPKSSEAVEAQKRLDSLKEKMERTK